MTCARGEVNPTTRVEIEHAIKRNCATRDALREIVALDQFHDEGADAGGFLDRMDRGDMRMIQGRERLG